MSYCPRIKTLIGSWDAKPGFLAIVRMRCRQWDCPYCATKNADQWRGHLLHAFCDLMTEKHWIFVTLTVPPELHRLSPDVSLKRLKKAWDKLYDKLRYLGKGRLSYVLVFETHKSGIFHAHALCDLGEHYDKYTVWDFSNMERSEKIDAEKMHPVCLWLSKKAVDTGLGWVCHVTRIQEGQSGKDNARLAVGYATKYFSKGVGEIVLPKRHRRICTSRDIGSPRSKRDKPYTWFLKSPVKGSSNTEGQIWLLSEDRTLKASDFGDDGYYPPLE